MLFARGFMRRWKISRKGRAWERPACGGRLNSRPFGRIWRFIPCAATSIPGCANLSRGNMTPSSWPRLGKMELIKQIIPTEIMCPAAGQGALGIEIREGDSATRQHLEFLNDAAARAATTCERALLNRLGGGCQVPIGAFAEMKNGRLHLEAIVADPDGSKLLRESRDGDLNDPEALGNAVGEALLRRGGDEILEAVYGRGLAVPPQP